MVLRLLWKCCFLFIAVAIVECAIFVAPIRSNVEEEDYLASWGTKHNLLFGPGAGRLILAGGSNVAFGLDSSKMQMASGRETINMGLHMDLGLAFMLHEVEHGARRGDLVVFAPEYEEFCGDLMDGDLVAVELVHQHWSALRYLASPLQLEHLVKNVPTLTSRQTFALIDNVKTSLLGRFSDRRRATGAATSPGKFTVYRRDAFDTHGDMVAHLDRPSSVARVVERVRKNTRPINSRATAALADTAQVLAARGVEFVVVYPSVAASYWKINRDASERIAHALRAAWAPTAPGDWVFADTLFYDTPYHLNRAGRAQRTERLIQLLRARVPSWTPSGTPTTRLDGAASIPE